MLFNHIVIFSVAYFLCFKAACIGNLDLPPLISQEKSSLFPLPTDIGSCFAISFFFRYKYLWADGSRVKNPIEVPAPEYIKLMFECV